MNPTEEDLSELRRVAEIGRGALIRFLMERASTEADADDFLSLISRAERAEAENGEVLRLLASIWFYGGFKAETPNEARLQALMERAGFWPIKNEAALFAVLDQPRTALKAKE